MELLEKGPEYDYEIENMKIENVNDLYVCDAIMERSHQGAHKIGRFLMLKKKMACCDLDMNNKRKSRKIKEDRVLVDN